MERRPETSSSSEKRFRKHRLTFGREGDPTAASDPECNTALDKGIDGIANSDLSVRKLKDLANVVANWFKNNKTKFSPDIQKQLEAFQKTVHDTFVDYNGLSKYMLFNDNTMDQKSQKAKKAIDDYLRYAKTQIEFENLESQKKQAQLATDYINNHKEAFEELGYNIKKLNKMQLEDNSLREAFSREPDNTKYRDLFVDNFRAIIEMADHLKDFLNIDHHLVSKRDAERKERIEKLLEGLPNKGDRPTLSDLPREQWWRLFIDRSRHSEAEKKDDPGMLFDDDQSPGYKQCMMELFDTMLISAQNCEQKYMNYDDYTSIHNIAIKFDSSFNGKRDEMYQMGGIDKLTEEYTRYRIDPAENVEILHERIKAFQEMRNECINGLPLFQNWQSEEEEYIEHVVHSIGQSSPRAITIGWVRHDYKPTALEQSKQFYAAERGHTIMIPSYRKQDGPRHVNSVLTLYYQGRETREDQTEYQRLTAIAETIRRLHVMHPKRDGNGRINMSGLMNKWLIEEGFSPAILPNDPEVFIGLKTLDGLVEDMVSGMHLFMGEVEQNKKNTVSAIETTH